SGARQTTGPSPSARTATTRSRPATAATSPVNMRWASTPTRRAGSPYRRAGTARSSQAHTEGSRSATRLAVPHGLAVSSTAQTSGSASGTRSRSEHARDLLEPLEGRTARDAVELLPADGPRRLPPCRRRVLLRDL